MLSQYPSFKSAQSMKCIENSKLDGLLSLIQSDSDESKVAGLLLIPKTIDCNDEKGMLQIFRAVGFSFLLRLLSSPGSPGDPTDECCLYKVLALNLLSTFCIIPAIAAVLCREPYFLAVIPDLLKCAQTSSIRKTSINDIITIMQTLSGFCHGRETLIKAEALLILAELTNEDSMPLDSALKIFEIYDSVSNINGFPDKVVKSVPGLVKTFCTSMTMSKFEAFARLVGVLSSADETLQTELRRSIDRRQQCSIRDALMELLRNRVRGEHRRNIFLCAVCMFDIFGPDWAMQPSPADSADMHGKFVQLLLAMCNVEVRIRLEGPLKPADNRVAVPVCLALLEHAIAFLTDESDPPNAWAALTPEALLHLRKQLEEAADGTRPHARLRPARRTWLTLVRGGCGASGAGIRGGGRG